MTFNPHDHKPAATFDEEMKAEPPAALKSQGQFVMALYSDEQKQQLVGYLGTNQVWLNYAEVAPRERALKIEQFQYNAVTLYRNLDRLQTWRYLSVSTFAYVGWYLWNGATAWSLEPNGRFASLWNGQNLSVTDYKNPGQYLYAWNAYQQLYVKPEPV